MASETPARPSRTRSRAEGDLGQRRDRRDAARARHSVHRAQSRRELPRPARQPRQLPRQRAPADAALPARGDRGRDRPRLRQGTGRTMGARAALERRPDARDDGDLQRLVRPRADADPRRDRARGTRRAAGRGSTGSTPRPTRARWCATTPSGTTSPASVPAALRGAAARGADRADARRAGRPISISTPRSRKRRSARCRRCPMSAPLRRPRAVLAEAKHRGGAARCSRPRSSPLILAGRVAREPGLRGTRASRSPRSCRRRCSPTSRRPPLSRPTIRCMPAPPGDLPRRAREGDARGRRRALARLDRHRGHAEAGVGRRAVGAR